MILSTVIVIKVCLAVCVLLMGYRLFGKKIAKRYLIYLSVLMCLFAFCADYIAGFLPPLTDTITLTALGEKHENSKGMEICLIGYSIDDKEFLAGKSLEIESGHWFWGGETYAWRPETDSRQPDGVTRTVSFKLPVGWDRALNFQGSKWCGFVEIDNGNDVWVEDTYTEDSSVKSVYIGRSVTFLLILNQAQYLLLYLVILMILSSLTALITTKSSQNPEKTKEWLDKNNGKLIYAGIAFVTFLMMFHYAGKFSFWVDEMAQVSFTAGTLFDTLQYCLTLENSTPPLELLLHTIWYHFAPYGEEWLLLPSIFLSALSIYIVGMIGEILHKKYCGILAAIFMTSSNTFWMNVAYEYRSYSFFVFFSVLTLYCYIKRNCCFENIKYYLLFSLSLLGLSMVNYFGMIALCWYFLADLYLFLNKKIKWINGLVYILPGLISISWLIIVQLNQQSSILNYMTWMSAPGIASIRSLLKFLSGNVEFTYFLLCLGIAYVLCKVLQKSHVFSWNTFFYSFLLIMFLGTTFAFFIYGNFINSSSSMWVNRYFLFLLPNAVLLPAVALCNLLSFSYRGIECQRVLCCLLIIYLFLNCVLGISASKSSEPFREAADWIYTQSNYVFNDDTLVIGTQIPSAIEGWQNYYIARQNRRDKLNVVSSHDISNEDILLYKRIYVQYSHSKVSSRLQTLLDENYKLKEDKKDIQVRVYVRK